MRRVKFSCINNIKYIPNDELIYIYNNKSLLWWNNIDYQHFRIEYIFDQNRKISPQFYFTFNNTFHNQENTL